MYGYVKPKPLKEVPVDDLGGGLNEMAPPNKIAIKDCITGENFRVAEDGKTKEKRPGLTKLDSIYDFVSKKVYGAFGIEKEEEVEIAAFLEDDIQLKSGNEWESIFSPTKQIDKPISVVQDKGLVLVAGYEKLITIKEGEANYSGIERPESAPTVVTQTASTEKKTAEYPESNQDHCGELGQDAKQTLLAQSFKVGWNCELTKIKIKLKKVGGPTGNLWAEIHESKSGTSTTKNASENIAGEGTDNLDVSTLTGAFATKELSFSGIKPSLEADKTYYLVVYRNFSVSSTNYVKVGFDCSSPEYSDGKYWEINSSLAWTYFDCLDLVFEIHGKYTEPVELVSYGFLETGTWNELRSEEDGSNYLLSQSFRIAENSVLHNIKIPLRRFNRTGYLWAEIHSSQAGTSKNKGASANIVGDPSDNVNCNTVPNDFTWIEFTFSGTKPSLTIHQTTVDQFSQVSQKVLYVASTTDFAVGEIVIIGRGTEREELKVIDSIQTGVSLTMTENLTYAHTVEQADTVENTYSLVLYCNGEYEENEYMEWTCEDPGEYADGEAFMIDDGMAWHGGADCSFKIYGLITEDKKLNEYAFSNIDDIKELREANESTLLAQEVKVYEDSDVTKVKLYLSKVGSLTGKFIWAEIHSAQGGISLTKNLSDNIVGEASDNVDADSLSAFPTHGLITFTFSGVKPDIKADTIYYIVIYGDFDVSSSNYVRVGMDKIEPTYTVGKRWDINDQLDWTAKENIDFIFELWTSVGDLVGDYSYVVTYLRWGNYPCESNPSPPSEKVNIIEGKEFKLTNIPVSSEPEVTHKNIYRTKAGLEKRYWVERILNSVTQYTDSLADSGLGDEVSYENYPPPVGDCIEIWDDTLWVSGVPGYMEGLFRSRLGYLEQFPATAISYMPLREGEADRVVRTKEFKNVLYPFKSNSIWVMGKSGVSYVMDKIVTETGLAAADSLVDCVEFLTFLSNHYKIELFDGYKIITPKMSNKLKKTLKSINKPYAYRSTGQYYEAENEYRLAIPTGSSMVPNKLIVYNTKTKNFFVDTYHQNICSIDILDISKSERVMLYGTSLGELYKVDPDATKDDGQLINMRFRTGWIGSQKWLTLRKMWIDYILPENKILVFKVYSNFRESPELNINLKGSTPTGADPELRNVIHQKVGMAIKGSFFSFEFINTEDTEGLLQVISLWLYLKTEPSKRTIKAS